MCADYGLLKPLLKGIHDDDDLDLEIIATGMHLSPAFGMTLTDIEEDGFVVSARVEMLLGSDSPTAIAKSMGIGQIGFADAFQRLDPDVVVVLGQVGGRL